MGLKNELDDRAFFHVQVNIVLPLQHALQHSPTRYIMALLWLLNDSKHQKNLHIYWGPLSGRYITIDLSLPSALFSFKPISPNYTQSLARCNFASAIAGQTPCLLSCKLQVDQFVNLTKPDLTSTLMDLNRPSSSVHYMHILNSPTSSTIRAILKPFVSALSSAAVRATLHENVHDVSSSLFWLATIPIPLPHDPRYRLRPCRPYHSFRVVLRSSILRLIFSGGHYVPSRGHTALLQSSKGVSSFLMP